MPKQKAPRPTKTNTGDYLLDFDGTDFSQFGGQQAQQQEEEPGLMSKIGSSAQAIAEGATMSEDPDFPLLQALENNYTKGKNGAPSKAEKADIFTRRTIAEPKIIEHAETPQDALHAQLADIGRVDIPGIAKMTGLSEQAVIDDLHGTIFQNPKGTRWETADDYLSGNVRKKLAEAKKAAEKDVKFKENVKALEAVQPQDVPPQDIRVDLGAGWVPSARVEEFAAKVLGISPSDVSARYSKELAQWSLNVKKSGLSNEYGTPERSALELLNDSLNLKQAKIQIDTPEGVIVNKEATIAAREAQRKLHVPNYFPHHRYGNYFIQAKIGDEVVFRQHFDALNTQAAKQRAAMRSQ